MITKWFNTKIIFSILGEAVLQFLNGNWKQIVEEFGAPILDRLVKICFNNVKTFFERVPKDELFSF